MTAPLLRIGTRASPLALAQTDQVRQRLAVAHPALAPADAVEVVPIRTTGDRIQDRTLAEVGGKGLFTKEIEEALLEGSIDMAVHSMKDMPTRLPDGLVLGCFCERADPRDVLIAGDAKSIAELPPGALIGTASLRRQALLRHRRPDLVVVPLRGNVQTRLRKLADGEVQGTLLARAGLDRLCRHDLGYAVPIDEILPAVGQGAICVEHAEGNDRVAALLEPINHWPTAQCVQAEHALLAVLDGSCRTPIAAFAQISGERMRFRALIAKPDGTIVHGTERNGGVGDGIAMGRDAADELKARGGPGFFAP